MCTSNLGGTSSSSQDCVHAHSGIARLLWDFQGIRRRKKFNQTFNGVSRDNHWRHFSMVGRVYWCYRSLTPDELFWQALLHVSMWEMYRKSMSLRINSYWYVSNLYWHLYWSCHRNRWPEQFTPMSRRTIFLHHSISVWGKLKIRSDQRKG